MDMIAGQQGQNISKTLNGKLRILFVTVAVAFLGLSHIAAADSYKLNPGDEVEYRCGTKRTYKKPSPCYPTV